MIQDILTVMWKEQRGFLRVRGSRTRFLMILCSPLFLVTYSAWEEGARWFPHFSPLLAGLISVLMVGITIPESFAGERERHTLSTLLASRLPDRAIFIGKMAAAIVFAWGLTILFLALGALVVNVAHAAGRPLFFPASTLAINTALSVILATLCAGAGVLISLRASTSQEATQILMAVFLLFPMLLGPVLFALRTKIGPILAGIDPMRIVLLVLAALAVLDVAVMGIALKRFQRSKLIFT